MVFWYFFCLNLFEDCYLTSNYHRQGRETVKQRFMRCFVAVCDNPAYKLCHYARQRGIQRCETWCSSGTTSAVQTQNALNIVGFIVLSSTGANVFTDIKTHSTRATQITQFQQWRSCVNLQL